MSLFFWTTFCFNFIRGKEVSIMKLLIVESIIALWVIMEGLAQGFEPVAGFF